jgi:hypothetical protein
METITFEEIKQLFLETREQMKETDKKFRETDKQFQDTKELLDSKFRDTDKKFQDTDKKFQDTDKKFQDTDKKFQDTDKKFQDTDKKFQDTDKKFRVTDKKFQETDRMIKELTTNMSGISNSNGAMAEEFFFSALENTMQLGKLRFDYIDRNLRRKRNNTEAQYDMIMYNAYKVVIVEVKYNFTEKQLREFYEKRLKKFRILFPEYKEYKIYGCIAALVIDEKVKQEAENYGFIVITQNNQDIKILNDKDYQPNEIK